MKGVIDKKLNLNKIEGGITKAIDSHRSSVRSQTGGGHTPKIIINMGLGTDFVTARRQILVSESNAQDINKHIELTARKNEKEVYHNKGAFKGIFMHNEAEHAWSGLSKFAKGKRLHEQTLEGNENFLLLLLFSSLITRNEKAFNHA